MPLFKKGKTDADEAAIDRAEKILEEMKSEIVSFHSELQVAADVLSHETPKSESGRESQTESRAE